MEVINKGNSWLLVDSKDGVIIGSYDSRIEAHVAFIHIV